MKDCNSTADVAYCCIGGIDPIIITDDDIHPEGEEDSDLDQYDVESLAGVGSTILVLGGLIILVASKQQKKKGEGEGEGEEENM